MTMVVMRRRRWRPTDDFGSASQASSLGISESLRLASELFEQNTVLFLKVLDHRLLVLIDPTSDGDQEELKVRRHEIK